jgi:2-oxoglutarate ferredoxin oxidoreductase subunit beta
MIEKGEPIPEDMYVVGELTRRNRPAMGVKP